MKESRIAIFIPAYNAAATLPLVLDRIPTDVRQRVTQIFVIDDASSDNTHHVGKSYQKLFGVDKLKILRNEINQGYGGNQKRAYRYAMEQGFDIIVMLHGDAQYAPERIPDLLQPLEKNEADMVFGSRIAGNPLQGGMPIHKFLGNKFLTAVENAVLGMNLTEFHSGFRAFGCQALSKVPFDRCSNNYHFDTEIIIQFKIKGLRIAEVPIPTYYGKERSYLNIVNYGFNVLSAMVQYWLWSRGLAHIKKFEF